MNIECKDMLATGVGEDLVGAMYGDITGDSRSKAHSFSKMKALADGAVLLREGRFIKPQEKGSAKRLVA